jgi:hypothetical protein
MALELVLLAQRDEHGHGDQAAGFQVQARTLPDVAPGVARDVLLDGRGELGGAAKARATKSSPITCLRVARPLSNWESMV